MRTFAALTLRGDTVKTGIEVSEGMVLFKPHWGWLRHSPDLLATSPTVREGLLTLVHVLVTEYGPVLYPTNGNPEAELVLVQQYTPGSGHKKYPGFYVELGPENELLASAENTVGSGSEHWKLVTAPVGWSCNIARQFVNERLEPTQTIRYNPD